MLPELDAYIEECRRRPFVWMEHDCAHFAAGWVQCRTGRDPLADLVGMPRSLRAHLRLIRQAGGFKAIGTERLGEPIPGLMAQRGDVVLIRSGRRVQSASGYAFGVCTGAHVAAPGAKGIAFLDANGWEAAWRIA